MKKLISLLLAAAMMVSVAACGGAPATSSTPTPATPGAEAPADTAVPQVANIAMLTDPDTLDPGRADDEQKNAIVMEIQETLIRLIDGKIEPAGAESWETSADGLVWTFHLRDNKYSDGTPVKAEDYVNSVHRIFDPEVNCHNAGIFYCIVGGEEFNTGTGPKENVMAKALDDKTLEFTLKEPLPYFLQLANFGNLSPVPSSKTQGAANAAYGATAEEMSYSGPFMIESWTRGSKIILKKNPNYWDAANVKLETVNMILVQDENTRQQMFDQNQLDILVGIKSEYADNLKPKIDAGEIAYTEGPQPRASYICFNNNDPEGIFTNENIRKAFSLAIDRESLAKNVQKKDQGAYELHPKS